MTDEQRRRILALAADYDTAPTKIAKAVRRAALIDAIRAPDSLRVMLPGGWSAPNTHKARAVRLWAVASRRTHPRGRPTTNRPHRLDVPATAATRDAVHAHAKRTGKSRATVAGDFLEVGAIAATNPPKGDGGCDE